MLDGVIIITYAESSDWTTEITPCTIGTILLMYRFLVIIFSAGLADTVAASSTAPAISVTAGYGSFMHALSYEILRLLGRL